MMEMHKVLPESPQPQAVPGLSEGEEVGTGEGLPTPDQVLETGPKPKKTRGRPFQKGQIANPAGRPKFSSVYDMAREHAPRAVRTIIEVMKDDTAKPSDRMAACREVLRLAGVYEAIESAPRPKDGPDNRASAAQMATEELLRLANLHQG